MNKHVRQYLTALAILASAWPLAAQTTNPAPAAKPEEVVVLTPFEVKSTSDKGYQATETLAGTRIRTDLKDVGSAITVITKEFLQDIGATDNSTLLQYTPNAEVAGTHGTFGGMGNATSVDESGNLRAPASAQRVRGLASADNARDFFVTDIPWDSYLVDRIDIQRGPNSILFGLGSPAGMVNASLRAPEFRNRGSVEARTGSYGSVRASLDVNQELIDKVLAIRVDGLWNRERYQQDGAFSNDKRYYGALRFEPQLFKDRSAHTILKANFEHGDIQADRPRTTPPNDSITPWFRGVDTTSLNGGMSKLTVNNAYEIGSAPGTTSNWLADVANQQQPIWLFDGLTGQLQRIYGGMVNTGARNAAGVPQGAGVALIGQRFSGILYGLNSMNSYAVNSQLPSYQYGQYRTASLRDPTVFDFYNKLIDGPTKSEFEKWDTYNFDLTQTAFKDRLGVELSFDRQKYRRGGQALLGGGPTLNLDILRNFQDLAANANFGRPYVSSSGGGSGNSYQSDRKSVRASLFGEVRASDYLDKDGFLAKLLGRQRFNGVYANEKYFTENLRWQMYANDRAWASYKLQGNPDGFLNLPPVAIIYLGSSLANATSGSGAGISGIGNPITIQSGNLYAFSSTWLNPTGVNFTDPWNVPASLSPVFNGNPVINPATGLPYAQLTQVSNPANYVGWNTVFQMNPMSYNNGADRSLLTAASKTLRQTTSYAGSWQGYMWNDAIVPTLGWRYDEVKGKGATAQSVAANRGALNLDPTVYKLPDVYPTNQIFKDHSASGGVVVHLNKILGGDRDPLPINVSLSYNKSSNFQVADTRRDIYGNPIGNPTGRTKDYGILLSTKDGKYSLRALKYETTYAGSSIQLDNSGFYNTIRDGLNWRNIKTYYMSAYAWSTSGQPQNANYTGTRYQWDPVWVDSNGRPVASGTVAVGPAGSTLETQAQADAHRDASIAALNAMQTYLAAKGYFAAWNYAPGPTTASALQTRGQFAANPILPDPTSVYDYRTAPLLQGFAVTADTLSKGYEFEFTANPLSNWRISFNASRTTATRTNVGGPVLDELVAYMDTLMAGPAGDMIRFNSDYSAGNQLRINWTGWRGQYTLLKLQEGAAASELRKWRYNVVSNYTFRNGMLKNVGVGGSYRWQDKIIIGYPVVAGTGGLASFNLSKPYYGPSEESLDLWTSYERRLSDKVNWKIQLNIRNFLKNDGLIPISVQPDGTTWASVRVQPVQEWFVTNTFSF